MNNDLFTLIDDGSSVSVIFKKNTIEYASDISFFNDGFFDAIKGKNVLLQGRSTVEIYSYAVYWCVRQGCKSISIEEFNLKKKLLIYTNTQECSDKLPEWCRLERKNDFLVLSIVSPSTSDGKWPEKTILENCSCFKFAAGSNPLILTGKGSLLFYAIMACSAAVSSYDNVFVDKPTEQTLLRISGNIFPPKKLNARKGKMIGILGDPNSGKSVFSRAFGCILEKYSNKSIWVYDCDAAALTSDWYIYGLQQARSQEDEIKIKENRNSLKQKWTEKLEQAVSRHMENAKSCLDFVVADFPGGRHDDAKNIHLRVTDARRASMLRSCDYFVIIGRPDRPGAIEGWKSALAEYNLAERIVSEIISQKPDAAPSVEESFFDGNGVFHATVSGLDRKNLRNSIVESFAPSFQELAESLLSAAALHRPTLS